MAQTRKTTSSGKSTTSNKSKSASSAGKRASKKGAAGNRTTKKSTAQKSSSKKSAAKKSTSRKSTSKKSTAPKNTASKNTTKKRSTAVSSAAESMRTPANRSLETARPVRAARRRGFFDYEEEASMSLSKEIRFYILVVFFAFLFLSNFGIIGKFGELVSGTMFGVFGLLAYPLPIILLAGSIYHMMNRGNANVRGKFMGIFLFILGICLLLTLLCGDTHGLAPLESFTKCQSEKTGGGIIGGILYCIIGLIFGDVGAYISVFLLLLIAIILFFSISLIEVAKDNGVFEFRFFPLEDDFYVEYENEDYEDEDYEEEADTYKPLRITDQRRDEIDAPNQIGTSLVPKRKRSPVSDTSDTSVEPLAAAFGLTVDNRPAAPNGRKRIDSGYFNLTDIHDSVPEHASDNHRELTSIYDGIPVPKTEGADAKASDTAASKAKPKRKNSGKSKAITLTDEPIPVHSDEMGEIILDPYPPHKASDIAPEPSAVPTLLDPDPDPVPEPEPDYPEESWDIPDQWGTTEEDSQEYESYEELKQLSHKPESTRPTPIPVVPEPELPAEPARRRTRMSQAEMDYGTSAVAEQIESEKQETEVSYTLPPIDLLQRPRGSSGGAGIGELERTKAKLQETLTVFGVNASVTDYSTGPAVTRFEITPAPGVKVNRIVGLADDIKLALAASDIRIEAPIPGKSAVGIEVPNGKASMVSFRELIDTAEFDRESSKLAFAVGKDIGGAVMVKDIARMPHLLIAGATGSGKSVCINTIIMSILYKARPDEVKLIMIDPKVVELSVYNGIPHLLIPVVTDPKKAANALNWAVQEMTDRYNKFANWGVRDIKGYNKKVDQINAMDTEQKEERMFQIVIIVDELADLMMVASKDVEESICRLAQLARACGIHLIIATQRPSVNVITGLIKANMPSRIAFAVTSGIDSRTILDMNGAEKLLGKGDMLFSPQGAPKPLRVQGAFVSDDEVAAVVDFIKEQNSNVITFDANDIQKKMDSMPSAGMAASGGSAESESGDPYFAEAGKIICDKEKASIGMLQRYLKVGFNRAARIMDQLEDAGVVGPEEGTKPRSVLMSLEQFENYLEQNG